MKVLFIYSLDDIQSIQKPLRSWASIQFGISYISSLLKDHGHQTRLLVLGDNQWKQSIQLLQRSMEDFDPGLICFTATYSQYTFIEKIARYTKNHWPDKYTLIGGVHPSLNPNDVIQGPFDALCIGEGEYPTLELCDQLADNNVPGRIKNLWIKSPGGKVERNLPRDFIQDLDLLPFPDREIWEPWMKTQLDAEFAVLLGRGCPYNCTYCSNHAIRKIASGKYVRFRSPENIVAEVASLYNQYHPNRIYLEVETIAVNKPWAIALCDHLADFNKTMDHPISYGCNYRISPGSVDEDLFAAFQKANFKKINIGLESGSERIRREVLKRNYSNQDFIDVVSMARKYGLSVYVYNMIGLPGETVDEHMETVSLNRQVQPDQHYTGIFFPYPGTELYDICIERGYLPHQINTQMERRKAVIDLPEFSKAQIQHAYTWFEYRVYRGYKPLWVIMIQVFVTKIRSNPSTNYLFRQIVQLPLLRQLRAKIASS